MEEIEKLYKNKLSDTESSGLVSNGLGLLEIARFTRNEFKYELTETAENEFFYSIKINAG